MLTFVRGQPPHGIEAILALQRPLRAAGLAVQRIALDVADHVPVHRDLVHVARAVAEPLQLFAAGQGAVAALAQRVVAVAPDQWLWQGLAGCRLRVGQVLLHLFGELAQRVIGKAHAGRAIERLAHAPQAVVGVVAGRFGVGQGGSGWMVLIPLVASTWRLVAGIFDGDEFVVRVVVVAVLFSLPDE